MSDHALQAMLSDPRARQAISNHARSNPETDRVKRVQQAVASIAPHLADRAAAHARRALSTQFKAHKSILAHARRAPDGHLYVEHQPGKFARVINDTNGRGLSPARQSPVAPGAPSSNNSGTANGPGPSGSVEGSALSPNVRDIDFIRHGETDLNGESANSSEDRIRGHKDVPLNQAGRNQAAKTGAEIASNPNERPDVLVSSDLSRSRETAQIISQKTGVPVSWVSDHFRPWDAGQLTGQPSKKAVPIMAKYAEQFPDKPLPKGEAFHSFLGRFFIGLHHALTAHPGKRVAVVAHHRNERALHSWAAKGYPPDGAVDHKVFAEKGEKTGKVQKISIPMDRLAQVAQRWQNAAMAPTPDRPEDERPGQE